MEYVISSGALTARVSSTGAQLVSLKYENAEYLWQGGPEWPRRAPVCCPYCGAVEGGAFTWGGKTYAAPRHGFVRDAEHALAERGGESLAFTFELGKNDGRWPWPFALRAEYRLGVDALALRYDVVNTGAEPMPLQLGFHPGFIAPAGSVIRAEKPELPGGTDTLALAPGLFDSGASIDLAAPRSDWFRLERPDGRSVTVGARGFAWFLLWGAPGATPFACLEPWSGYPGPGGMFDRPDAAALAPGESFTRTLNISLA